MSLSLSSTSFLSLYEHTNKHVSLFMSNLVPLDQSQVQKTQITFSYVTLSVVSVVKQLHFFQVLEDKKLTSHWS